MKSAPALRQQPGAWRRRPRLQRVGHDSHSGDHGSRRIAGLRRLRPRRKSKMSTTADVIPDWLVLAAIECAERHRTNDVPGVPIWAITEHLDIPRRSGRARHVRSRLRAFEDDGSLESSRYRRVQIWALTPPGRQRLRHAVRAGDTPQLPESPQHRAWRRARTIASAEMERLRRSLRKTLAVAVGLLDSNRPVHSDRWFELAECLSTEATQLGRAVHCLHEWAEPDDRHADIDSRREPSDRRLAPDERGRRQHWRIGRRIIFPFRASVEGAGR